VSGEREAEIRETRRAIVDDLIAAERELVAGETTTLEDVLAAIDGEETTGASQ
jgi:hypothetical protein